MNIDKLYIFTDGSCLNNGKKSSIGSIGIYFDNDNINNISQIIDDDNKITNQTMELLACIQALNIIKEKINNNELTTKIIYVYTDSTYVINCITKWYNNWQKNNWKTSKGKDVENKELIEVLYNLKNENITIFKHVKAHQPEPNDKNSLKYKLWYGNNIADKLATNASHQFLQENNNENITKKKINKKNVKQELNI
jgi:ribonuclease HI